MTTGPVGSAYAAFGERYRAALAVHGIELRLVPTGGSYDNLVRLSDPRSAISAGFVQAGTTSTAESPDSLSLGTMFYEPLWSSAAARPTRATWRSPAVSAPTCPSGPRAARRGRWRYG